MKALVMAPSFFGYDKAIVKGLEDRGYSVDFLDSEQLKPEYWSLWNKSFLSKAARHIIPGRRDRDRKNADKLFSQTYLQRYLDQIDSSQDAYSLVLTVKGDFIQDDLYSILKRNNPQARFILYLWDDVRLLHRKDYFSFFDDVYSYNCLDCRKYGWRFLPVFVQDYDASGTHEKKYDIAIIGTGHRERVRFAKRVYEKYKDKYSFFIYLFRKDKVKSNFFTEDSPMSYKDYMDILRQSKCVLEYPLKNQRGPTTRIYDSMRCGTKVITTNRYIRSYPVNQSNILVINRCNPVIPKSFVDRSASEDTALVMNNTKWLEKIMRHE